MTFTFCKFAFQCLFVACHECEREFQVINFLPVTLHTLGMIITPFLLRFQHYLFYHIFKKMQALKELNLTVLLWFSKSLQ